MNKKLKGVGIIVIIILTFLGCGHTDSTKEIIKLNKGAFTSESNGRFIQQNIVSNDIIEELKLSKYIITYNSYSSNSLLFNEEKYSINSDGKEITLESESIVHPRFSQRGDYLFYFTNFDFLKPMVLDVKNNAVVEMKNKVVISGRYIDWIDNDNLVYYGIDYESKIGGIFSYNIHTEKEELIYNIDSGYIDYLEYSNGYIYFHHIKSNDEKILLSLSSNNDIEVISNKIMELKDVIHIDEKVFFIGRTINNTTSIYKVEDNDIKRVLYDFPNIIMADKGLSQDEDGNLLFIGSTSGVKEETIYKYKDGTVTVLTENIGKYYFIDIN